MKTQHFLQKEELPLSQKEDREWRVLLMILSEQGSPCTPALRVCSASPWSPLWKDGKSALQREADGFSLPEGH